MLNQPIKNKIIMPDNLSFLQRLHEYGYLGYAWILLVSFWAGTAKYLTSLNGKKPNFIGWLTETCVSGFVGIIAAMTCQYYQVDFLLTSAVTGICAHNGTRSLYLIGQLIKKNTPMISQMIEEPVKVKIAHRKGERNEKHDK